MLRQSVAVLKSGDRTMKLRNLHIPALVIHGASDRMIDVSGGKATAAAIPSVRQSSPQIMQRAQSIRITENEAIDFIQNRH
jgi:pimeloyl-ACP methyl ester carboxylesterase